MGLNTKIVRRTTGAKSFYFQGWALANVFYINTLLVRVELCYAPNLTVLATIFRSKNILVRVIVIMWGKSQPNITLDGCRLDLDRLWLEF